MMTTSERSVLVQAITRLRELWCQEGLACSFYYVRESDLQRACAECYGGATHSTDCPVGQFEDAMASAGELATLVAASIPAPHSDEASATLDLSDLLAQAFEAGHFAWPTADQPTRTLLREAAITWILQAAPEQPVVVSPLPADWRSSTSARP